MDSGRVLALVAQQSTGFNIPTGSGGGHGNEELSLDDLFSLRRPKNVMSGASSGMQSLAKGAPALGAGTKFSLVDVSAV